MAQSSHTELSNSSHLWTLKDDSDHRTDTKQSTSTPCNLKVILQTIIVNFSLQDRFFSIGLWSVSWPWGERTRRWAECVLCRLSGSPMCDGKENMPPVFGLFKLFFQRLPSLFNANITDGSGPKPVANRKSLLILVFPNDAEEFSIVPLSSWLHFLKVYNCIVWL